MKYQPALYAEIFLKAAEKLRKEKMDLAVGSFLRFIRKNGDWASVGRILEELEKGLVRKKGGRIARLEFPREVSKETARKFTEKFRREDRLEFRVNPRLVAGVRVILDEDRELDMSFAKKIRRLFGAKSLD